MQENENDDQGRQRRRTGESKSFEHNLQDLAHDHKLMTALLSSNLAKNIPCPIQKTYQMEKAAKKELKKS